MDETIINRVRALRACGASLLEIARTMTDVDPALVWLAWFGAAIVDREPDQAQPDQAPTAHVFKIESRISKAFRWRAVTARPHRERYGFDPVTRVLRFHTFKDAVNAASDMARANAAEYRIVNVPEPATCALCGDATPCSSPKCAALDRTGYGWRANSATVRS